MLSKRIIPKLLLDTPSYDIDDLVVVRTHQFTDVYEVGDPVDQARIYQNQGVDELILINISQLPITSGKILSILNEISETIFMPLTVGGMVRTVDEVKCLLSNGADKVVINSAAFNSPSFIQECIAVVGSSCITVSIDFIQKNFDSYVVINSGKLVTDKLLCDWSLEAQNNGAGELLITSISNDGTSAGLCIEPIKKVVELTTVPVKASGGCGVAEHFSDVFLKTGVEAVAAGTFFCQQDQNPIQTRAQIKNSGVEILSKL